MLISDSTLNVKVYDNTNIKNTYGFFKLVARIKPFFSIKNMAAELRFAKFLLKNKQTMCFGQRGYHKCNSVHGVFHTHGVLRLIWGI